MSEHERMHCEWVAREVHDEQMAHAMGARDYASPHDVVVRILARERAEARREALEEAISAVDAPSKAMFVGAGAVKQRIRALIDAAVGR